MTTQIILNNAITTKPEAVARLLLDPYLRASPFPNPPRFEDLFLTIFSSDVTIDDTFVFPEAKYIGMIIGAEYEYNQDTRSTELSILIDALQLKTRRDNLSKVLNRDYNETLKLTLIHNLTGTDTNHHKWWINQILNDFNTKNRGSLIPFNGEFLETQPIIFLDNEL